MKIVAIVQARMGSKRLPGKVMKEVLGKPLLAYQIERIKRSKQIQQIIVATTMNHREQPIIDLCERLSIDVYRGSEDDVLARYYEAAKNVKADVIVRLTADCPLLSPKIIDQIICEYIAHVPKYDYVSNTLNRTYPRGMDTEVFSIYALEKAYKFGTKESAREHVTTYVIENPNQFNLRNIYYYKDYSHMRLTVDTSEDFQLVSNIIETLYPKNPNFELEDVLALLRNRQDWLLLNSHIEQKKVE